MTQQTIKKINPTKEAAEMGGDEVVRKRLYGTPFT